MKPPPKPADAPAAVKRIGWRTVTASYIRRLSCLGLTRKIPRHLWQSLHSMPVESTPHRIIKPFAITPGAHAVLFVTYQPKGPVPAFLRRHVAALKRHGKEIVWVRVVDALGSVPDDSLLALADGCVERQNAGFDLGAWAHGLKLFPSLYSAQTLILTNDSVVGPVNEKAYQSLLTRCENSACDLTGLTESRDSNDHIQTYFLSFRLRHPEVIEKFWKAVRNQSGKHQVIIHYEMWLTEYMTLSGLSCEILFPVPLKHARSNPTLEEWELLLENGFPFVKTALLRTGDRDLETKIRGALDRTGGTAALIDDVARQR